MPHHAKRLTRSLNNKRWCAIQPTGTTIALSDDTAVFVLLQYIIITKVLNKNFDVFPLPRRTVIDIIATVEENRAIIPCLLGAHAISGFGAVATYFGIGKGTVLKYLKANPQALAKMSCLDLPLSAVVEKAKMFIGDSYSQEAENFEISEIRYKV